MDCGETASLKPETVALRPPLAGAQRRYRGRRDRPRRPACDGPGALPRLLVVDDAGEPAADLDGGRQLALLLIDGADRGGIGFGDDEHGGVEGRGCCPGQALSGKRKGRPKGGPHSCRQDRLGRGGGLPPSLLTLPARRRRAVARCRAKIRVAEGALRPKPRPIWKPQSGSSDLRRRVRGSGSSGTESSIQLG